MAAVANDTDLESGALTAAGVGALSGGTVSGPSGGNVTFTDSAPLDGSFTYQANDGFLPGGAASVTVDNNCHSRHHTRRHGSLGNLYRRRDQ